MSSAVFPSRDIVAACERYLVTQQSMVARRRQRWIDTKSIQRDWPWRPWQKVGQYRAAALWNTDPHGARKSNRRLDDRIDPIYALLTLARAKGPYGVVTVLASEFIKIQPFYVPTESD